MKRLIDTHLKEWKKDKRRKPLLLKGARQIGKTYSVRQLGKDFDSFIEINFELVPQAKSLFDKDLDPHRIIWELGILTDKKIIPGKTLLFLDEIQAAPQAIIALRYFYEMLPDLHVIAAGSLLDFAIQKVGLPVGRVNILYVYPLSFIEFLAAVGKEQFIPPILSKKTLSEGLHNELINLLTLYLAIGGMPESVRAWIETKTPRESLEVQKSLVETYRLDFPKYAKKHQLPYLNALFDQIPNLVGKSFKYSLIHGDYKKRELAPCLELLEYANVINKILHSSGNGLPIGAGANFEKFKMILLDVGLTQTFLGLDLHTWLLDPVKDLLNKGSIVEAFVGQELLAYASPNAKYRLHFWKRESKGSLAEIDYLYESENQVIPIEIKSGKGTTLRSLHKFLEEHPSTPFGYRFWSENYSFIGKIDSRPLYAIATLMHPDQLIPIMNLVD